MGPAGILLGAFRQGTIFQFRLLFSIVADIIDDQVALLRDPQVDQPFFRVSGLADSFNGVIQTVAQQAAEVHGIDLVQQATVGNAGQGNPVLDAVGILSGQDNVNNRIAGLNISLILLDFILQALDILVPFIRIAFQGDDVQLVLQVMEALVDDFIAFPKSLILLILRVEHVVHVGQIPLQIVLIALVFLQGKEEQAAEVHEGPDSKNRKSIAYVKVSPGEEEANIADSKNHGHDQETVQGRLVGNVQEGVVVRGAFGQIMQAGDDQGVNDDHGQNFKALAKGLINELDAQAVNLPGQGGHEFRRYEGPAEVVEFNIRGCLF